MKKLYTARVKTSEYKSKDGSMKSNWETVGNIYEGDNGKKFMYLKKYFNPAGIDSSNGDSIILYFFPEDSSNNQSSTPQSQQNGNNDIFSQTLPLPPLFNNNDQSQFIFK